MSSCIIEPEWEVEEIPGPPLPDPDPDDDPFVGLEAEIEKGQELYSVNQQITDIHRQQTSSPSSSSSSSSSLRPIQLAVGGSRPVANINTYISERRQQPVSSPSLFQHHHTKGYQYANPSPPAVYKPIRPVYHMIDEDELEEKYNNSLDSTDVTHMDRSVSMSSSSSSGSSSSKSPTNNKKEEWRVGNVFVCKVQHKIYRIVSMEVSSISYEDDDKTKPDLSKCMYTQTSMCRETSDKIDSRVHSEEDERDVFAGIALFLIPRYKHIKPCLVTDKIQEKLEKRAFADAEMQKNRIKSLVEKGNRALDKNGVERVLTCPQWYLSAKAKYEERYKIEANRAKNVSLQKQCREKALTLKGHEVLGLIELESHINDQIEERMDSMLFDIPDIVSHLKEVVHKMKTGELGHEAMCILTLVTKSGQNILLSHIQKQQQQQQSKPLKINEPVAKKRKT